MKSFTVLLAAIAVAGATLAFDRFTNNQHHSYVQLIVGSMLAIIFVFLFRFLSRMND